MDAAAESVHSGMTAMAFEMLISPQTCTAFAEIFLCLNSAAA
jgi:hypothetical protein